MKSIGLAPVVLALSAVPAAAAPVVYNSAAGFAAATTGVTTQNFEGAAPEQSVLLFPGGAPFVQPGFTITQNTNNAFLSDPAGASRYYYYDWGTGDVINTPYLGVLTITFDTAVTAFALDLGSFYSMSFPFPPGVTPGAGTTLYGADVTIGTAQGNFTVDLASTRNFTFFGVTSDTAFTSFTITGATSQTGASTVLDNLRFGSAATGAVPEPASWAMMIAGFAIVGAGMRRRVMRTALRFA